MSRLTWMPNDFQHNYSKDPQMAAALLDSMLHRSLPDLRYALEVMKCDPNLIDASSGKSVFQQFLEIPESSDFIKLCINNGANCYKVGIFRNYDSFEGTTQDEIFIFAEKFHESLSNSLRSQINVPLKSQNAPAKL